MYLNSLKLSDDKKTYTLGINTQKCLFSFYSENTIIYLDNLVLVLHLYNLYNNLYIYKNTHHYWIFYVRFPFVQFITYSTAFVFIINHIILWLYLFFSIIVDLQDSVNLYCTAKWHSHTYIYIYIHSFSHIILHLVPSQVIIYGSLCYTEGSHCLSTPNAMVCIC